MARRITKKCVEYAQLSSAQLSAADAQVLHGKKGDGCWHDKRCPSKRSYYRNRRELNEKGDLTIGSKSLLGNLMVSRWRPYRSRWLQSQRLTPTSTYGITFFADEIRLEPIECPITGCPGDVGAAFPRENRFAQVEVDSS